MKNVLVVVGTRPEAIKMAPVVRELNKSSGAARACVCSTGQHREMLDQVLQLFAIRPDHELRVMQAEQTLSGLTANLLTALDRVIVEESPDWILAQGDTTTAFVAGLVAYYRNVRFGHIEAGLRTGNKRSPFPEEMNRRFADLLADAYFAPTEGARDSLISEGIAESAIFVTGNTVVDAVMDVARRPTTGEVGRYQHSSSTKDWC